MLLNMFQKSHPDGISGPDTGGPGLMVSIPFVLTLVYIKVKNKTEQIGV